MIERAKLVRRTAHVVSMIVPMALLVSVVLGARSQPPTPSPRESQRAKPNSNAAGAQNPTATYPRGTDYDPVVVQVKPTQKTDAETTKEKKQEQEKSSEQRWTVGLSLLTALGVLLQVVIIGVQARLMSRQNDIMERQNGLISGQLEASKQSAQAATNAAGVAEQTLRLSARPWLDTSEWRLDVEKRALRTIRIRITFAVMNFGQSPAKIETVEIKPWFLYPRRENLHEETRHLQSIIPPGQLIEQIIDLGTFEGDDEILSFYAKHSLAIVIQGQINYSDRIGKVRHKRFARYCTCDTEEGRFHFPSDGPGINDEDEWEE